METPLTVVQSRRRRFGERVGAVTGVQGEDMSTRRRSEAGGQAQGGAKRAQLEVVLSETPRNCHAA